jgi:hypothetical protein
VAPAPARWTVRDRVRTRQRCGGRPPSLTVSWRNAPQILAVANQISQALRGGARRCCRYGRRRPTSPGLSNPIVRCAYATTYVDEAGWIAEQIDGAGSTGMAPTVADPRRRCWYGPGHRLAPGAGVAPTRTAGRGGRPRRPARQPRRSATW